MANKPLRPGNRPSTSGQYERLHNGRPTGTEVTGVANKPLPPTPSKGDTYRLADRTKHKGSNP